MLQAQDIVMLVKLVLVPEDVSSVALAEALVWSQSQAHRSLKRLEQGRLVTVVQSPSGRSPGVRRLNRRAAFELLVGGVPQVFPVEPGRLVAGIATAGSAPILARNFRADPEPLVWPHPEGEVRGMAIQPLHPGVPELVRTDRPLYDLLALVDALRVGRARERKLAEKALKERLL